MNNGKYLFAQVISFLPVNDFIKCVKKYNGNYKVHHFTCWHQLMCMLFGQLANRDSLSDLVTCLNTQRDKWYHLGMGTGLSKSNLAYANENRDWHIFEEYAYILIAEARRICTSNNDFQLDIEGNVYAVDSTTVDLCLNVFWWAKFRKNKAAVKVHTQYDIKTDIPSYIYITDGSVHDVNFMDIMEYECGAYYVMDKAYVDFGRLYNIHEQNAFFITRLKDNTNYRRIYSAKVDKSTGVLCDQTIKLNNYVAAKKYPGKLRRIKYYDEIIGMNLEFVTNNFLLPALDIARLYKHRWGVELFFKWIKQHLKVKAFWGYSDNAVRVQIYTAIIAYVTVAIMKEKLKLKHSNYEILQILSITLLTKTQLQQLFQKSYLNNVKEQEANQLILL